MNTHCRKILETARLLVPGMDKKAASLDVLMGAITLTEGTLIYAANCLHLGPYLSQGMADIADYARQTGDFGFQIKEYLVAFGYPASALVSGALTARGAYHFFAARRNERNRKTEK